MASTDSGAASTSSAISTSDQISSGSFSKKCLASWSLETGTTSTSSLGTKLLCRRVRISSLAARVENRRSCLPLNATTAKKAIMPFEGDCIAHAHKGICYAL